MSRAEEWALRLLPVALLFGLLHHADHVLRADHSGWPFIDRVTPFTWSLLAYPLLLFAWLARRAPVLWRAALVTLLAALTLLAHVFVEAPHDQFAMWAHNHSNDPRAVGVTNLLDLRSPLLGLVAVTVSMVLNLLLVTIAALLLAASLRPARPP